MTTTAARPQDPALPIVGSAIAVPTISAVLSFGVAIAMTIVVYGLLDDGQSNEGDGLGLLLVYLACWLLAFVAVSIGIAMVFARSRWSQGRNWLLLSAVYALWVPASAVVGGGATWFAYRSGLELLGPLVGVIVALAMIASAVVGRRPGRLGRIWLIALGVAVVFVAGVVLLEPSHRRSIYQDSPPPMALVDEDALAEVLPGWRVAGYADAPRDAGWPFARAVVETADGVEIEITLAPDRMLCSPVSGTCDGLPALRDGSLTAVWRSGGSCGGVGRPSHIAVSAERPEGRWSVDSSVQCGRPNDPQPSVEEMRALLDTLLPVSVGEWVDAT